MIEGFFIIDGNADLANRAGEVCGYITGQKADDDGLNSFAVQMEDYCPKEFEQLEQIIDYEVSGGFDCPWGLWPTPGLFSDGYGGIYSGDTSEEDFYAGFVGNVKKRWECSKYLPKELVEQKIHDAIQGGPKKSGVNNSIAIYFMKKPSSELIDLMKKRAEELIANEFPKARITGYRFITRHITIKDVEEVI